MKKNIEKLYEEFEKETWSKPYTDIDEMFKDLGLDTKDLPKGKLKLDWLEVME